MYHDAPPSRSGRSKGEGWPGLEWEFWCTLVAGDKAFLCPFWPFDFEISREFWANPHITVIYIEPAFRRGERWSARPERQNSLKFQIYIRRLVIILILTPAA